MKQARAEDLMRRNVLCVKPDDSIADALAMLEDARIGGAPVMAADGRLVGVITLSDIARTEHLDGDHLDARVDDRSAADDSEPGEAFFLREDYDPEVLGQRRVADWMTESVIAVAPDTPLRRICRTMVDARIHRVFVVEGRQLLGVISSFDIVRWLAHDRSAS